VTHRLVRIEGLILSLTTIAAALALAAGGRPLGVVLGGGAAFLDFVLIRMLVATALSRRPSPTLAVPLALMKSLLLVAIPATALLLPAELVDGVSFAVGVSMLPLAIVADALWPLPAASGERGTR
jgi:hypothetical protein